MMNIIRKLRGKYRKFNGKTYKYLGTIRDVRHGGEGERGVKEVKALLWYDGTSVESVRTSTGWDLYGRKPWYHP